MSHMSNILLTLAAPAKFKKMLILLKCITYNKLGQKENSQLISKIFINRLYF